MRRSTIQVVLVALPACVTGPGAVQPASWVPAALEDGFTEPIEGTALSLDMVWVAGEGDVPGLWVSKTEIPWELYDAFVFRLDGSSPTSEAPVDAVSRPSKPYIAMDRGFGHAGYPAISMSLHGAQQFCQWLSHKTGRTYRLPTEAEWTSLCERSGIAPERAADHAWFKDNAQRKTHPVGSKQADALGLHDLWGNASEWCTTDDGKGVTMGGTFRDPLEAVGCAARVEPTPKWNDSDPQFPKSIWWLADAGFVGFRVVCEKK